jgi:hypothetical protein
MAGFGKSVMARRFPYVSSTEKPVPDGNYEIRRGNAVELITFKRGACGPSNRWLREC